MGLAITLPTVGEFLVFSAVVVIFALKVIAEAKIRGRWARDPDEGRSDEARSAESKHRVRGR